MQDVGELVVHGVELVFVEVIHVSRRVRGCGSPHFHLVNLDQGNLHACRGITKLFCSGRGRIGRGANEVDDSGSVLLHEIFSCILGIDIIEEVLDEVCQHLRLVVCSRCELILQLRCKQVELVLNLEVVGYDEVVVEPLVEGCRSGTLIDGRDAGVEDRLGEVVVLTAGGNRQRG